MTEREWLASESVKEMLASLRKDGDWNDAPQYRNIDNHRLRLWVEACRAEEEHISGQKVHKHGGLNLSDPRQLHCAVLHWEGSHPDDLTDFDRWRLFGPSVAVRATLLRCITGNPFKPLKPLHCPTCGGAGWYDFVYGENHHDTPDCDCGGLLHPVLTWNDGAVVKIAQVIDDSHDWSLLGQLSDALEEAGLASETPCPSCDGRGWLPGDMGCPACGATRPGTVGTGRVVNPVFSHLRGPGPHARGCHVIDWILGKL